MVCDTCWSIWACYICWFVLFTVLLECDIVEGFQIGEEEKYGICNRGVEDEIKAKMMIKSTNLLLMSIILM